MRKVFQNLNNLLGKNSFTIYGVTQIFVTKNLIFYLPIFTFIYNSKPFRKKINFLELLMGKFFKIFEPKIFLLVIYCVSKIFVIKISSFLFAYFLPLLGISSLLELKRFFLEFLNGKFFKIFERQNFSKKWQFLTLFWKDTKITA